MDAFGITSKEQALRMGRAVIQRVVLEKPKGAESMYYKLNGKIAVLCTPDSWIMPPAEERRVAQDDVDGLHVSTVFLGLDHGFGENAPMLFETMVFDSGNALDYQTRCSTWEEAEEMHRQAVAWVKAGTPKEVDNG